MRKSHMKHYFPCDEGAFSSGKGFPVLLGDMDLNPNCRGADRIMKPGAPAKIIHATTNAVCTLRESRYCEKTA